MAKFQLTLLFIMFSLGIASITVLILNKVSADVGERSLISVSTKLAETDAQLIAGALERMSAAEVTDGDRQVSVSELIASFNSGDPLAVLLTFLGPEVLEPLNVVNISLIGPNGVPSLAIGSEIDDAAPDLEQLIALSLSGEVVSVLQRNLDYTSTTGVQLQGDIVTSFVPIIPENGNPAFVMSLARDMSSELDEEIASTRAAMFKVALAAIGGLFVVLLAFIVWIDLRIWRGNRRLLDERLALAALERDRQELARLNESKDRFISTVSHELKTPLTTIMGYGEIMRRNRSGSLDERQIGYLEAMRDAGWRLDLLINDMLDITRIESGRLSLDKSPFEVCEFLRNALVGLQPFVAQRKQALQLEIQHSQLELKGDEARLTQCISNLVTNASKYSPPGSSVQVRSELMGDELLISVTDEGIGISEEDRQHLCSLFFRADNQQTRSQPGLGLGLFITAAIVENHGGILDLQSRPGAGTMATIRLRNVISRPDDATIAKTRSRPVVSRLAMLNSA
jgi:signal transduction histidine kinase